MFRSSNQTTRRSSIRVLAAIAALSAAALLATQSSHVAYAQTDGAPFVVDAAVSVEPIPLPSLDLGDKAPAMQSAEQLDLSTVDAQPLDVQPAVVDGDEPTTDASAEPGAETDGLYDTAYEAIDPSWDVDDWQFYALAGQSVVITMNRTWGGLDSYIELYNPYGQLRAVDDDSGGNGNSRLAGVIATTGYYTIRAHSYNYSSSGGYALSVSLGSGCGSCPPPPCGGEASVTVFDAPYFTGSGTTVPAGYMLRSYPGTSATSIRFNGACRNGGCAVVVYRFNGWTMEEYRAGTLYGDADYISLMYDNAISRIEVYRR